MHHVHHKRQGHTKSSNAALTHVLHTEISPYVKARKQKRNIESTAYISCTEVASSMNHTPNLAHHIELRWFRRVWLVRAMDKTKAACLLRLSLKTITVADFFHQGQPEVIPGGAPKQPVADVFNLFTQAFLTCSLLPLHSHNYFQILRIFLLLLFVHRAN